LALAGDIVVLGGLKNLTIVNFRECKGIVGDKSAIRKVLPKCNFLF